MPLAVGTVTVAAAVVFYALAAHHLIGGNSDGATVVLEGQSLAHGNLTLSGWTLSFDSFWTIDVPFYALADALVGVRPVLLTAVPIALAAAVLAVSVAIAAAGHRGRAGAVAVAAVAIVLAVPDRVFDSILLQGPLHVGTLLYCLIAFALVSRGAFGLRWVVAVVLLAAALLGDLQSLLLGVAPIGATWFVGVWRSRSPRTELPLAAAAFASVLLALVTRATLRVLGGFHLANANSTASPRQLLRNVVHLPVEFGSVLGIVNGPYGPSGVPMALRLVHLVSAALLVFGLVVAARAVIVQVRSTEPEIVDPSGLLDQFLLFGFVADLVTLVLLPITSSDAYSRYATAGVVMATILGARALAVTVERQAPSSRRRTGAVVVSLLVLGAYGWSYADSLSGPAVAASPKALAAYLVEHHLDHGVGDYWSASIVTVDSDEVAEVRPVVLDPSGRLVRYAKQSETSWYAQASFDYFVYDADSIWNGDTRAAAIATFGRPSSTMAVGDYRILYYRRPFSVSVNGYQGP